MTQSASILYLHDGHGVEESLCFNGIIRTGLNKVDSTTLGHLIAFMHTFNLRFGAAKTPVQEQTYDQLYPLLVAVRDQAKVPSANPFTTSSGPQDPKKVSAYFSGMKYDPKHGVVPPPPPPPGQP